MITQIFSTSKSCWLLKKFSLEEIQSQCFEYLPSSDSIKHHLSDLAGLLDWQFRLLHEDTVGQLQNTVQIEYKQLNKPFNDQSLPQWQKNCVQNIIYHKVTLLWLEFNQKKGLQVVTEFNQPLQLMKKGSKEWEEWWRNTKQLQNDAFVCLVSSTGQAIFFSVCNPTLTPPPKRKNGEEECEVHSTEY